MSWSCPRCTAEGHTTARWCGRCGAALDVAPAADASTPRRRGRWLSAVAGAVAVASLGAVLVTTDGRPAVLTVDPGAGEVVLPGRDGSPSAAGGPRPGTSEATAPDGSTPDARGVPDPDATVRSGLEWAARVPGDDGLAGHVVGDVLVTLSSSGRVTGRDLRDGRPRWRTDVPQAPDDVAEEIWAWYRSTQVDTPAQVLAPLGAVLPVRRGQTLTMLDPDTGRTLEQLVLPIVPDAAVSTGRQVLVSDGSTVLAVDADGRRVWQVDVPDGDVVHLHAHGAFLARPAGGDRGDESGRVTALDAAGDERWSTAIEGTPRPLPTTSNDRAPMVAVDGAAPALLALSPRDGSVRWEVPVDGEVTHVTVGGFRTLVGVRGDGEVEVLLLGLDELGSAEVRRRLLITDVDGLRQLTLAGREIVAVTTGPDPEVLFATPDAFLRTRRPAVGEVTVTVPDTRTVLIADDEGVRAIALTTGRERFHVPLERATPVGGAAVLFGGRDRVLAVDPSLGTAGAGTP